MDPLTQGSLGAVCAAAPGRRGERRAAAAVGALAGLAPDLDVLIRSSTDPLLFLDYHRQFSHALTFAPVGALLCALLTHWLFRRWLSPVRLYLFCLLGYGSHGLLDACTSYGTQLLWPFSDARVAWNVVSVVDPLYTGLLVALLVGGVLSRRRGWLLAALAWTVAYAGLGQIQHWRAADAAAELAAVRGHEAERQLVKPAFGNLLLWKSVYRAGGHYYVDALRLAVAPTIYPGERIPVLERDPAWRPPPPGSVQAQDLQRFERFSAGYLALDPDDDERVIDVRYSMLPNRIDALWGIRLDLESPDAHARFVTDRESTPAERAVLLDMLAAPGAPLPGDGAPR